MIFIQAVGALNALGPTPEAIRACLNVGESPGMLTSDAWLQEEREVMVGQVEGPLVAVPPGLAKYDCRNNRILLTALKQLQPALDDALSRYGRDRLAIVMGTSTSGLHEGELAIAALREKGELPPGFHYFQQELGSPSEFLSDLLNTTGPALTISTSCSSSARTFLSAARMIEAGLCDAALVGGADTLCRFTLNGFNALEALAKGRSNPFSVHRDGINIGEAGGLMLLSREPAAVALLGAGESSDAYHISSPDPQGGGAETAMRMALEDAGLKPRDVGYINLHGTGTPLNDRMESLAVHRVFPNGTPCSATKPMTGHTLGAAGITEAVLCWLVLTGPAGMQLPLHLWDGEADPALPALSFVGASTTAHKPVFLSNSFAFGGNNVSLILGRPGPHA